MIFVKHVLLVCLSLGLLSQCIQTLLIVNVKNKGGDVIREVITGNTTSDVVELQFRNTDGTIINQFIDFKSVRLQNVDLSRPTGCTLT